jgi:hypothetical protein
MVQCAEGGITKMKKLSILLLSFIAAVSVAGARPVAQDNSVKQDVKNAGKDTGDAAKKTGKDVKKGTKKGAKATANGTKKGVHKAAGATEKGADKVKDKTTPQ